MIWPFRKRPVDPRTVGLTRLDRDPLWWNMRHVGLSEDAQASARWRKRNAEALAAGCRCGRPATHVELHHGNGGWVPVEFWTCDDHIGVSAWHGSTPLFDRPTRCEGCPMNGTCSSGGPIGGPTRTYHCPEKVA